MSHGSRIEAQSLRSQGPAVARAVLARGDLTDCSNPSAALPGERGSGKGAGRVGVLQLLRVLSCNIVCRICVCTLRYVTYARTYLCTFLLPQALMGRIQAAATYSRVQLRRPPKGGSERGAPMMKSLSSHLGVNPFFGSPFSDPPFGGTATDALGFRRRESGISGVRPRADSLLEGWNSTPTRGVPKFEGSADAAGRQNRDPKIPGASNLGTLVPHSETGGACSEPPPRTSSGGLEPPIRPQKKSGQKIARQNLQK